MPELREVFEMVTKQTEPDVDAWRQQEQRQRASSRTKKVGAIAVAAAFGVAAIAVIVTMRGRQDTSTPATEPTVAPEEIAIGFLEAFGAFDADRAIAYLAHDADITGILEVGNVHSVPGTLEEFRLVLKLWQAQGLRLMLGPCSEVEGTASGTTLDCTFDYHILGSDELGLGPYDNSSFRLTVRDEQVVEASMLPDTTGFVPELWEPFADWVSTTYPEDAAVMYTEGGDGRTTTRSIPLWEQHVRDYVEAVKQGTA